MIDTTYGYTETHLIHVVAHDSAGNKTKSEAVRVFVIPEQEDEEDAQAFAQPFLATSRHLWPDLDHNNTSQLVKLRAEGVSLASGQR